MMDPTQAAPGAQPGGAPAGGDAGQGETICITAQPDGTFIVFDADQGPDSGQPAQDAESATQLALQMLQGGPDGDSDDTGSGGGSGGTAQDADALFSQGFNGVRGK